MATVLSVGSGTSSSNAFSTGSLSWGTNCAALLCVATAWNSGSPTSHTVTGGGVTWVQVSGTAQTYRARRAISVLLATDGSGNIATPSTGALTVTSVGGSSTFAEAKWDAVEVAEYNATTGIPKDGSSLSAADTGLTALNASSIGTLSAGDIAFIAGACEGGSVAFAVAAGTTGLTSSTGGSDVRSFVTGYSTSDETPGVTWNSTSVGAGIVAFIIPDGSDGTHGGGGGPTVKPWGYYAQL